MWVFLGCGEAEHHGDGAEQLTSMQQEPMRKRSEDVASLLKMGFTF